MLENSSTGTWLEYLITGLSTYEKSNAVSMVVPMAVPMVVSTTKVINYRYLSTST